MCKRRERGPKARSTPPARPRIFYMLAGDCMPIKSPPNTSSDYLDDNGLRFQSRALTISESDWQLRPGWKEERLDLSALVSPNAPKKAVLLACFELQKRLGLTRE